MKKFRENGIDRLRNGQLPRRYLVTLVEATFTTRGTSAEIISDRNDKWNKKFWEFKLPGKKDNLERLTEIFKAN